VPPAGTAAYAFNSSATGRTVRVIVLDYSSGSLSGSGGAQLSWLEAELGSAKQAGIPAIVVGGDDITDSNQPNYASDAGAVSAALLSGGASAYLFYDISGQNVSETLGTGSNTIPVYGTGTLGYVSPPITAPEVADFLGASGYLLVSVHPAQRNASTNRAPVTAQLIPNAGQLGLDAVDGTLLRRSTVSLFEGLARRPLGGEEWVGGTPGSERESPDPYTVLPETCLGSDCGEFIPPQYSFSSSDPSIGNFVEHDPNSTNPIQILQSSNGAPIPDPTSGLFCAFNPGTTTVTISAGGLSYSEPVTVQGGSVEEPCGTVPATTITTPAPGVGTTPPPAPVPAPAPAPVPPPPPSAKLPAVKVVTPPAASALVLPFAPATAPSARALFPVSTLTPRPTPPTGFSSVAVTSPVPGRVVEEEREEEEAVESARANFTAYHPDAPPDPILPAVAIILLVLAIGGSGAGIRRRYRPRGTVAFARAEVRRDHDRWSPRSGRYR
jgi:hypothetical protein